MRRLVCVDVVSFYFFFKGSSVKGGCDRCYFVIISKIFIECCNLIIIWDSCIGFISWFDIVLEIVVLLSMEMVFVFVLDIVVLEGGVINWCVIDFNVEVVFGVVV